MNRQHPRLARLARLGGFALAGLIVTAAIAFPARTALAQDEPASPSPTAVSVSTPRTITVVGVGKVRVEPDIARVNIGVDVARPTVREASDANQEIVDAVIEAILATGVAEKDVQTTGYSVYADRYGTSGPLPEDEIQYRVTNNVTVVVRDIAATGDVLDSAIEAGANNIYGVEFAVNDPTAYQSEAMAKAVNSANSKAAELAELTGVKLGEIISVSETIGANPLLLGVSQNMNQALMGGGGGTAVQPGMMELALQLQIVYAIEP